MSEDKKEKDTKEKKEAEKTAEVKVADKSSEKEEKKVVKEEVKDIKKEDKPKSLVDQLKGQLFNQALGLGQQHRSLSSRLIDSMKNSPYGGYLNPSNALSNMEDYFSRLF